MATNKQRKAEQRVTTALTTPEWVRFSYDVVDQIIGEVNLPHQTNLVDGKESENEAKCPLSTADDFGRETAEIDFERKAETKTKRIRLRLFPRCLVNRSADQ